MQVKTILNRIQKYKSFVYGAVRFIDTADEPHIEAFKSRQKRTDLWRKKGGTHYISVPLADLLEEEFVVSSLRQAGCISEKIKTFITSTKS